MLEAYDTTLQTIDKIDAKRQKPRNGFRPFHGLGREERYAEVLGHELGHAVWALESPKRARLMFELQTRPRKFAWTLWRSKSSVVRRQMGKLEAQCEAIEIPARETEVRVWAELVASQAERRGQNASSSRPGSVASRIRQ